MNKIMGWNLSSVELAEKIVRLRWANPTYKVAFQTLGKKFKFS
jgi:hypothetical protein